MNNFEVLYQYSLENIQPRSHISLKIMKTCSSSRNLTVFENEFWLPTGRYGYINSIQAWKEGNKNSHSEQKSHDFMANLSPGFINLSTFRAPQIKKSLTKCF